MEYNGLIGKTITAATQKKLVDYDDSGYLELQFSDGTKVIVVASYGSYTGGSYGEYPTGIFITDKLEDEYGEHFELEDII